MPSWVILYKPHVQRTCTPAIFFNVKHVLEVIKDFTHISQATRRVPVRSCFPNFRLNVIRHDASCNNAFIAYLDFQYYDVEFKHLTRKILEREGTIYDYLIKCPTAILLSNICSSSRPETSGQYKFFSGTS